MPNFTTGPAVLPDVGTLSYNGCIFSSLFQSTVSGVVVQDKSARTTKLMEFTITVDGVATLPDGDSTIEDVTAEMRKLLTAEAGVLVYKGRGTNITVNFPGSPILDVAWGPIPALLDFQSLGGSRSALVKWQVKTRIPEVPPSGGSRLGFGTGPVLQFCEEVSVIYNEDGYSTLSVRGILEIPLTRITQNARTFNTTVDNFRDNYLNTVANGIDLTLFRVMRRDLNVSEDRRTLNWDFAAEELPPQGLPPAVTIARGSFNFRPSKAGVGLCNWLCTLRVTYTVRKDRPRRIAWLAFLALLRERMRASRFGLVPPPGGPQNPGPVTINTIAQGTAINPALGIGLAGIDLWRRITALQNANALSLRRAWLIDFSGDEGLYLDSKTMTFSATWRLVTTFDRILVASGLWRYVPTDGGNIWAINMRDIQGPNSWLVNRVNPDVIVDFGGP